MRYRVSREAAKDLEEIWLYTRENWSEEQADRYFALLLDEIKYAAKNPLTGRDYTHVKHGYRRTNAKSHYIFYRMDETEKMIEVVRILHQRMDIDERLND